MYVSLPYRQRTRSDERHLQIPDYRLDSRGMAVRFPAGAGDISLPQRTCWLWGLPQPDQRVPMSLSPDISRPGCDFDDLPLSVVDFKTVMSCTSTPPYVLVSWCKG